MQLALKGVLDDASASPAASTLRAGAQGAQGAGQDANPLTSASGVALPPSVEAAVWRGTELGHSVSDEVAPTGWPELDAELPGGGWPHRSVTEVLAAQPALLEWRLLAPGLRPIVARGGQIVVIGPPRHPHVPGLVNEGLDERQLVWIKAERPAERLWVTEQVIKSNAAGAIVVWLTQARQEQLRRLQVCAAGCEGLVFLCRPEATRHEASAAPLRLLASLGMDWELKVDVFKRRGPAHDRTLTLPSVPASLAPVLTPRLRKPSGLISRDLPSRDLPVREAVHAVGRPVVAPVRQLSAVR